MKYKVAWVVTVPSAVQSFLMPHLSALAQDYELTLFVNGTRREIPNLPANINVVPIGIRREISPLYDLIVLIRLWFHFRQLRPKLVHSVLPKSGLLAMTAARFARVPVRLHSFTGQVWAVRRGLPRRILRAVDRWTASCATAVITDSPSQRRFLMDERVVADAVVFGAGSICGVDGERFHPSPLRRQHARRAWAIDQQAFVIGFLGRINRDKGILDLARAFSAAALPDNSRLVLAGPDEEGLEAEVRELLGARADHCVFTGHVDRPEVILPGFDLFCLPSYREGFGTSVLEASACEIPVLASRIYGLTDAVAEGQTGWLHAPGDVAQLAAGLEHAVTSKSSRLAMGKAGRAWALERFAAAAIVDAQRAFYHHRLGQERKA